MSRVVYGVGGLIPAHPSQNRVEQWDDGTSTYTRWNAAGTVVESRAFTAPEATLATLDTASATATTNKATLESRATTALANNATFLAIGAPSNAQIVAQAQALTRQVDALIRLALGRLDTITDA
jgi:hypothetical protein